MGESRGTAAKVLAFLKNLGVDYSFPYVWPIPGGKKPVETQMNSMKQTRDANVLPQIPTVSQAWSGWNDEAVV